MEKIKVSASILSADFSRLREEIRDVEIAGVDSIHLDIMDGVFVPNLTFGPMICEVIRKLTKLPLYAHLMIIDPIRYVDQFAKAGCDLIYFHPEAESPVAETISLIRTSGKGVGLAINPETDASSIKKFLGELDGVLVMSVNPGFAGQEFIKEVLPKIRLLKRIREEEGFSYEIAVDGGINDETAPFVKEAGADVLVTASFLFNSPDKEKVVQFLKG
jgi:ribulose-phosphate 3-epimerase